MKYGLRDAQGFFFDKTTNEVVEAYGYEENKQKEINKLIKHRSEAKKKRIKNKINKKLNTLLNR